MEFSTAEKCAFAALTLTQIAILCEGFETKSLSGQGEEIIFNDKSELIVLDDGGYLTYNKTLDIYMSYDNEGQII